MRRSISRAPSNDRLSVSPRTSRCGGSTPTLAGAHPSERWSDWRTVCPTPRPLPRRPSVPRRSTYREGLAAAGVSDAVVAPGAEEALARRSRVGWLLHPGALAARRGGAPRQRGPHGARVRGRATSDAAGDPRDRQVPDGDRRVRGELGACFAGGCSPTPPSRGSSRSRRVRSAASPRCGAWGGLIRARRARLGLRTLAGAAAVLEDLRARRVRLVEAVRAAARADVARPGTGPVT